jgi:hypothetical protein
MRYFLIVATDARTGVVRGVRDGTILINPGYARDLCVIYLSHIIVPPESRGTVMSYWLRIAPVDVAVQYMHDLHLRGAIELPDPSAPGRFFGMRLDLAAEMEYWSPENRLSLQRILFYGRGGFDAINPRHFPYRQPDFREPEEIASTGNQQLPFMILLRRIGRERQANLPIAEAKAVMDLLYDDFECFCKPENLASSLDIVMDRLDARAATGKSSVELLPLPTGPRDLHRLKKLFKLHVFQRYYGDSPETRPYLRSGIAEVVRKNPRYLDQQLDQIRTELSNRPHWVYGNRDRGFTWEGQPEEPEPELLLPDDPAEVTAEVVTSVDRPRFHFHF